MMLSVFQGTSPSINEAKPEAQAIPQTNLGTHMRAPCGMPISKEEYEEFLGYHANCFYIEEISSVALIFAVVQ